MLYLALPVDLRDRYPKSVWLAYARRIDEATWQPGDTLVTSEWIIPDRHRLLQTLSRVRQQGVRVVFVGPKVHETDAFKRDLCLMDVYDFLFVEEELVLQELDDLLAHPRMREDVAAFLTEETVAMLTPLRVVDVLSGEGDPFLWAPVREERQPRFDTLVQPRASTSSRDAKTPEAARPVRTFVWPTPTPVRVHIEGDRGCGKSFLALQLLSLCHAQELPAALVEDEPTSVQAWCEPRLADHVTNEEPPLGYRVMIDTRSDVGACDLILVVTWPGTTALSPPVCRSETPVVWVVNHHTPGVLWSTPADIDCLFLAHEPRQFHAMRMQTPLVELDPTFARLFDPLMERIAALFVDPDRRPMIGGDAHVVAARA